MEIKGKAPRYQVWSKKLVCGFLVKGKTLSTGGILFNIPNTQIEITTEIPEKVELEDVKVVILEIKITDEESIPVLFRGRKHAGRPHKKGYAASLLGVRGSRSIVLYNQYPKYQAGDDYVWKAEHRRRDSSVCIPLSRLKLPHFFYDLEFTAGHLEMYVDNPALLPYFRERAKALLDKIKEELSKTHPAWRYTPFKTYFKGIGVYKK